MICGLGTDIVEISRIKKSLERFGIRFIEKVLNADEIRHWQERQNQAIVPNIETIPAYTLAARFSVKEASVKALGTGFSQGISLHDISVFNLPSGQPQIVFTGKALEIFKKIGASHSHVSLSHARDVACAVVILEK